MTKDEITSLQKHIDYLFWAELQFRLASAVRVATTFSEQPLDLPVQWVHGKHAVDYSDVAIRQDQADFAASVLHNSSIYLMAVAMKDAIKVAIPNPKASGNADVRAAYQIARFIRNAFAHAPFSPIWSIDSDCRDTTFRIAGIVEVDTTGLHGTPFRWQQYGGPLAILRLCQFVRREILGDKRPPRKILPKPRYHVIQQGNLLLRRLPESEVPPLGKLAEIEPGTDGSLDLGGGHTISGQDAKLYEWRQPEE